MQQQNTAWWQDKDPHTSIMAALKYIKSEQASWKDVCLQHLRLYGSVDLLGGGTPAYITAGGRAIQSTNERNRWNLIKSCVDTLCSKVAKNKPKPEYIASGGDFSLKKRVKLLNKFTLGQFEALEIHRIAEDCFKDACWHGTCVLKIDREGERIFAERVFPLEVWVDDLEGKYGDRPRNIYQVKPVPRDVLIAKYPNYRYQIEHAGESESDILTSNRRTDCVDVVESWHLRSGPEETDGRHCLCINGATLLDEEYTRDYLPFVFFRWNKRPVGFWGEGVCEQLRGIQYEINLLLLKLQQGFDFQFSYWILAHQNDDIPNEHFSNNGRPKVIRYVNAPPQIYAPNVTSSDATNHLDRCWQRGFELVGLSQLSASSKNPLGANASGAAFREYNDIESERFHYAGRQWEYFFLDVAQHLLKLGKEIHEETGSYSVPLRGRKFIGAIDWEDVEMEDDQYSMYVFPVSMLPTRMEGRLAYVQELAQAGLIPQDKVLDLLNFPNIESFQSQVEAKRDYIREIVDRMLFDLQYAAPEPLDDLEFALTYTSDTYAQAKLDGAPEEALQLLRDFILDIQGIAEAAQAPAPAPGGQPLAAPEAPPTSPLIPNAPVPQAA